MRVELIHPPHPNSTDDRLDPPLGLLMIASYLKQEMPDVTVTLTDLSGQDGFSVRKADFYGITTYATSFHWTEKLVEYLRKYSPEAKIVVGGAHPSAVPDLFTFADHVVIGEGEDAMAKIVKGEIEERCVRSKSLVSPDLWPCFMLIDVKSYRRRINNLPSLPLLTSRGCPYKCAFCGLNCMHELGGFRLADPEKVKINISLLVNRYGIKAINFQDDMFTAKRSRLFQLLDLIKPMGIVFRCHGRAGYDIEEVYERLAEAGCVQVAWGIESGSQRMLDRMNKQATVEQNYQVIQWAKKYGITSRAFFILGFPGETKETIEETKKFIEAANPDQYFVSNFVPYPGTDVWNDPKKYGIKKMSEDFDEYYQVGKEGTGGLTIDTEWLTREEFRKLELGFREWISRRQFRGPMLDYEKEIYGEKNIIF